MSLEKHLANIASFEEALLFQLIKVFKEENIPKNGVLSASFSNLREYTEEERDILDILLKEQSKKNPLYASERQNDITKMLHLLSSYRDTLNTSTDDARKMGEQGFKAGLLIASCLLRGI